MADYDEDDPKNKKHPLHPSQILNSQKQLQKKEEYFFMKSSKSKFIDLEKDLLDKNSYFSRSKIPEINKYDKEKQMKAEQDKFRQTHKIDLDYCQKCPAHKNHCPHKNQKDQIKDKYSYPILSSSTIGWMPEIDTFKSNFRVNQETKTFWDSTHLG